MNRIKSKLIALDIDGTIIDKPAGFSVPEEVREAVRDARKAGIKVCLCSARPCYFMDDATRGLEKVDALIGCNGALIEKDGEHFYRKAIPLAALIACFKTAKRLGAYVSFAGDEKIFVYKKGPLLPSESGPDFVYMEEDELLAAFLAEDFYCAYVFPGEAMSKEEIFLGSGFSYAAIHRSSEDSFTLTKSGTDKGTGILRLAEFWGIPREAILAVGNDENDIPMFNAAGTGVAVANASPETLAAADWVAPDVWSAGAAEAIRRFAL